MPIVGNVGYYNASPGVVLPKGYTYLLHQDPANADGHILNVKINAAVGTGVDTAKVSVFEKVGLNYYQRDFANISIPATGGEHTLTLSKPLGINNGWFIAIYTPNRDLNGVTTFTRSAMRLPGDASVFTPGATVGNCPVCYADIEASAGRPFFQGVP